MSHFVAREKQITRLKIALRRAIKGQLQIVFITGEAGAGKTTLVETFVEHAQREMPHLLTAGSKCQAIAGGQQESYQSFTHILAHLLEVAPVRKPHEALRDFLKRGWDEAGSDLLQLIPAVGGPLVAAKSIFEWLQDESRSRQSPPDPDSRLKQYVDILRLMSQTSPLLLWIDDLQWSDAGTVNLISYLADYAKDSRIMLIITYRPTNIASKVRGQPHPVRRLVNKLKRPPAQCAELPLPAFTLADVDEYLNASGYRFSSAFVERLWRNSGGNPLFIKEYVIFLHKCQLLKREHGAHVLNQPDAEVEVPTDVQHVIEQRMSLIEREVRQTLSYASIQGARFSSVVLAQLLPFTEELVVLENLNELEHDHKLIRELEDQHIVAAPGEEYEFIHAAVQQFIYDQLSSAQRRRLHLCVGEFLEELYADKAQRRASDLAIHFERGGNPERAIPYYLQAGRHALNFVALDDALAQTEAALQLTEKLDKDEHVIEWQIRTLIQLAEVYHRKAEHQSALNNLNQGLKLAHPEDSVLLARLLCVRCAALNSIGRLSEAIQDGEKAIQIAQAVSARSEEAHAYNNLGVAYGRDSIDQALACHRRSLDIRRDLNLTHETAQSLVNLAIASAIFSGQKKDEGSLDEAEELLGEAEKYLEEAKTIRENIGDKYGLGSVYHNWARVHLERGQLKAAEDKFLRAMDLWKQIGYSKGIAFVHNDLGRRVCVMQEHWEDARTHLEESASIYESIDAERYLGENYMALADVYRNLGQFTDALTAAQEALKWATDSEKKQKAEALVQEFQQANNSNEE